MLLQELRYHTSSAHQQVEKLLVPRIRSVASMYDYASLLRVFYGYFKPLEDNIDHHLEKQYLPDYEQRRKAASLAADLGHISGSADIIYCADLPRITNTFQAIGALYVMEGSVLGGKVIKAMLLKNLPADTLQGFEFFSGYGEDTGAMWKAFTDALDNNFNMPGAHDEIVTAANDTFLKFKDWAGSN